MKLIDRKSLRLLGLLATGVLGLALPAHAQVAVAISGAQGKSEATCTQINRLFGSADCTYGGTNAVGTALGGWTGPSQGAAYYALGSAGDSITYVPVPGDARINVPITGTLNITGSGAGASIDGTIIVGAAARNVPLNPPARAVQRWSSITHTIASTAVNSATANVAGGFDYVIASRGAPELICIAGGGACFGNHESGANEQTGPAGFWGVAGVGGVKPGFGIENFDALAGIPATGTTDQRNFGATTTAVVADPTCDATARTPPAVAFCSPVGGNVNLWGPTGPEDPGWENLILLFSTDAAGNITAGRAYWTQNFRFGLFPGQPPGDDSEQLGTFTFTGSAAADPMPAAPDAPLVISTQGVAPQSVTGTLDVATLAGYAPGDAPTVLSVTQGASGTVSAAGSTVSYTPNASAFAGTDTFTYTLEDGDGDTDQGTITVNTPDLMPVIANGAITTNQDTASAAFQPAITAGNGAPAQHTLTVTVDGTNGSCAVTAANATGQVVYTPDADFFGTDSCQLTLTDGNGDSDTTTINVTVEEAIVVVFNGGSSALDPWSLASLGGLPLLRRRRTAALKVAVVAAASMATSGVLAAGAGNDGGLYLGAGVSGTSLKSDLLSADLATLLNGSALAGQVEDFPLGVQLFEGWMFNRHWGVEGRYSATGKAKSDIFVRRVVSGTEDKVGSAEVSLNGWTVYGVGNWPLGERFELFAKLGYTDQTLDADAAVDDGGEGVGSLSASESDGGLAAALGTRWRFTEHWAATAEGEYLGVDVNGGLDEPWRVGVNVEYWFGRR
jgi:hypothetical protein